MPFRAARMLSLALLVHAVVLARPVAAQPQAVPPGCVTGVLPSQALSLVCVPPVWNGQLVVYAPGYTAPQLPLGFYQLTTPDGVSIPELIGSFGFAFATTSYRQNGLAVLEGVEDVRELAVAFRAVHGPPLRTHITGVSYGSLVATLLAERYPAEFHSALAACGPIGSFRGQVNYIGDFRVLFDYFFPNTIPGSPIDVPPAVAAQWTTVYVPLITARLAANPARAVELLRVAHAAFNPADPSTVVRTTLNLLWYNVFGSRDATVKLGGNPFNNRGRLYFGSTNDLRLNLLVRRFGSAPAAEAAMAAYETNGDLRIPLVTLHTTGDEIAPFAHELLYWPKVDTAARGQWVPIPVARYGHCSFTATEIGLSFLFTVGLP
jgi:pimeloyl-ACP methyl ester carboxylesterase